MTWQRGRETIQRLLDERELERVEPSVALAERLLDEADRHVRSARLILDEDPSGSYQMAYDAARKAISSLLAIQGLRATSRGGHIAVQDAVRDQFNGTQGIKELAAFPRMRRRRAESEYPNFNTPTTTRADAADAIEKAAGMLDASRRLLNSGHLTPFR